MFVLWCRKLVISPFFLFCAFLLLAFCGFCPNGLGFQNNVPEKVVWAVLGKTAELPCDVTPPTPADNAKLILWFKDNSIVPIYSLDARSGRLSQASHLTISGDLGNRSYFIMDKDSSRAHLKIDLVREKDQGSYRCRVDFVNSPTRNFQVNLTLVEQPSAPRVFDAEGREINRNSSAGPFLEGEKLFLSCQINGGRPRPSLSWWFNNSILDNVVDTSPNSFTTVNQLFIGKVTRNLKGAKFECRATSSENAGFIIRTIPLIIFLKPNKVKIVTPNELMSTRKSQNVKCETSGSYPPAKLTWLLDGKPIKQAIVTEEETEFFTASIITLSVNSFDDGKELACRADNPHFPGGSAIDKRQIHVAYPPKVAVKLDQEVLLPVKEGVEIKLKCESRARPLSHNYRWYHEGHIVHYNETAGVLPMDDTLVLKRVEISDAGQYACSASNSEGETYSSPYDLVIQYPPRCKKGHEITRIGSVPFKEQSVECQVESVPEVTKFFWTYNTSREVLRVRDAKIQNVDSSSTLHFSPYHMDDLQSLSCWAQNDLGQQKEPCLFYVVIADPPEAPKDCVIRNTSNNIEVVCSAGNDGGLEQSFVLEVTDITPSVVEASASSATSTLSDEGEHQPPLYRVLGEQPEFKLPNLQGGREYRATVYAENARGKSLPNEVRPSIRIPSGLEGTKNGKQTRNENSDTSITQTLNLTVVLVALTICISLLIVGIIAAASVLACKKTHNVKMRTRRVRIDPKPPDEFELNSEAGFSEGFHRRSLEYRASMYSPDEVEIRISRIIEEQPEIQTATINKRRALCQNNFIR